MGHLMLIAILFLVIDPQLTNSYLKPEHQSVIEDWLQRRSDLRLALDADNMNKDGLAVMRKERGRGYHPYYASGDFNGDGKEDFAVAFIRKKKSKWPFIFVIFNGPFTKNARPAYITDADMADGGIMYNPTAKARTGRLLFGTFETDDCVILVPHGHSYVTRNCLD